MSGPAFDRRTTPARPDLAAAHWRGIVAADRYAEGVRHAVAVPSVPLRREARADVGIDTELLWGEGVVVYDRDGEGWAWGQAEMDGYVGWLPAAALGAADPPAATHKVLSQRSFVFPAPSIKAPALMALPFGSRVAVLERDGDFARMADGYLWAGHLAEIDHVATDVVGVAEAFVGVPYLWGGRTSLGLDCSALVQTALAACGRPAPRDSDMQEHALGRPVDPDGPLRRGDLVFWRGHVGLMRDPETLLHANGHTMTVALETLAAARARILAAGGGPVTAARRLAD